MHRHIALRIAVAVVAHVAGAQSRPPVRELGKLERVTTDSLRSAAEVVQMSGGRVLVNDPFSRRVLLLDSTLAHPVVVADTTSATAGAYGTHRGGTIMRYRNDSALYIDQAALTMFVVPPSGVLGRVMAFPQPPTRESGGQLYTAAESGPPGFDARGRLIYVNEPGGQPGGMTLIGGCCLDDKASASAPILGPNMYVDSSFAFRIDLATRRTDTIGAVKRGKGIMRIRREGDHIGAIENAFDPLPVIDQWTVLANGTFAIVRGRDYHIDWLGADGAWTSTPKMEFDWQRVSDARKRKLQDSVETAWRAQRSANTGRGAPSPSGSAGGGRGGGRGGDGGAGGGGGGGIAPSAGPRIEVPNVAIQLPLDSIADYVPAFTRGAVRSDAEGNIWIRTSTVVRDRPVYDIVDQRGQIIDRVQLPANRVIAGFGPGVVYLSVRETTGGNARVERVRIK